MSLMGKPCGETVGQLDVILSDVERHDGGERQDVLMGSMLLYTTMKIPTIT